ncbi:MAG: hypothetical protein II897_06835 [Clostridia bacterium]|nr:hypothetical protein [Clostridia bacterium]
MNSNEVYDYIRKISVTACEKMNDFSANVLKTRGGRIGSGMGALLEALWGYMMNQIIHEHSELDCEIAWFPDNQYNDFSCIKKDVVWDEMSREGEYFRIEVKSMNTGADESKAHFAALQKEIEPNDALLILVWEWRQIDETHFSPIVIDSFFDRASGVAELRDALHVARGGSFVMAGHCPDLCEDSPCRHVGEPLNASGKRERLGGPESTRPSLNVSYAANFGGLVRMIKTDNESARSVFRQIRKENAVADHYISFIHKNFPKEEKNQYTTVELRRVAAQLGIINCANNKDALYQQVSSIDGYQDALRDCF